MGGTKRIAELSIYQELKRVDDNKKNTQELLPWGWVLRGMRL
jgi:hypothetical protein